MLSLFVDFLAVAMRRLCGIPVRDAVFVFPGVFSRGIRLGLWLAIYFPS